MTDADRHAQQDQHSAEAAQPARHYVNHIALSVSLSEVRIDLGQDFPDEHSPRPQCRLVTSPVHLQRIEHSIAAALSLYRSRFGLIGEPGGWSRADGSPAADAPADTSPDLPGPEGRH